MTGLLLLDPFGWTVDWAAPFLPGLENKIVREVQYQLERKFQRHRPYIQEESR